jgi:hypothetical protein
MLLAFEGLGTVPPRQGPFSSTSSARPAITISRIGLAEGFRPAR